MRTAMKTYRRRRSARTLARAGLAALATTAGAGTLLLAASAPASADPIALGGYDIVGAASGLSVFYEQPNFPIPATPTLEFNLGYSNSTFDSGPVGTANGSAFWPGQVIAGGGNQLPLLFNPYLQQYIPQLEAPVDAVLPSNLTYPVDAMSNYPQGPPSATNNNGPMAMSSSTSQTDSKAASSVGIVGGPADQSAVPAGMLEIQAVGSSVDDGVNAAGDAVSTATSTVHGVNFGGGLIQIGTITSTATSTSDGNQASVTGTSSVAGASILGQAVTIDANGVHAVGQSAGLLGSLLPTANQVLNTLGMTITLTNPTDTVSGASAIRQLNGLQVDINFATFDQGYQTLYNSLPSQIKSAYLQLPTGSIPTPYKQDLTLDMGWVNVNSAASPPFSLDLGGLGSDLGTLSTASTGLLPTGSITNLGSTPTITSPSAPSTPGGPAPSLATASPALFRGLGAGLVALALLLAIGVMAGLLGADRAVGTMAAAPACIDEENPDLI